MDEFERELKQALVRRPAPPSLKRRILARRKGRPVHRPEMMWMRMAASLLIVALLGGAGRWGWQEHQERVRGEEAKRQVLLALRITGHALDEVSVRVK
jgi:hypothetical protein